MKLACSHARARQVATALVMAGMGASAQAEWQFDFDAAARFDNNINNAYSHADIRSDTALALNGAAASHVAQSGTDSLALGVDASGALFDRFHGLDQFGVGASADYRHKFGTGYAVPWLQLSASAADDVYQSALRNGERVTLVAELGQRFTTAFDAAFGATYERRYARNDEPVVPGISGAVFDLRGQSAYARAAYAIDDRLSLDALLSARRGDVVATTRRDLDIFRASAAIADDPTFGPDFFAYRLRGTTDVASLGASWALDGHSSINLVYDNARTDAAGGIVYRSQAASMVFTWHF